jgi:hypothetical protein
VVHHDIVQRGLYPLKACPRKYGLSLVKVSFERWHHRLGHSSPLIVQRVLKNNDLPFSEKSNSESPPPPRTAPPSLASMGSPPHPAPALSSSAHADNDDVTRPCLYHAQQPHIPSFFPCKRSICLVSIQSLCDVITFTLAIFLAKLS